MNESLIYLLLKSGKKSFRVGNYVFFMRMGKLCARRLSDKCRGKNWKRTPQRVMWNEYFTGSRRMSSHIKDVYEEFPVWQTAALLRAGNNHTSDSFRHSINHAYIDGKGNVTDFKHFVVSDGALVLPSNLALEREGNTLCLTWEDNRDIPAARGSDFPYAIVIGETRPDALMLVRDNGATRAGGSAIFTVKARENEDLQFTRFSGTRGATLSRLTSIFSPPQLDRPNVNRASFRLLVTVHDVDDIAVIVPDGVAHPFTRSTLHVRDTDLVFFRAG